MTFDATNALILSGLITAIIASIAAAAVQIITALQRSNRDLSVAKDVEAIKGHVNSEKTASDGRESALRKENELLREMLSDKKATASLLAQAAASRERIVPVASAPAAIESSAAIESLKKIDSNTEAIANNTSSQ